MGARRTGATQTFGGGTGFTSPSLTKVETRDSTLKFQIRALACSSTAFVHASTEGRACWDFFDSSLSASKRFAFKCHRAVAESVGGANRPVETVFPVHDIAFHPTEGTFATVGGDGTLCMWDGSVKKRIWRTSKFDNEISGVGFSADGNHLA